MEVLLGVCWLVFDICDDFGIYVWISGFLVVRSVLLYFTEFGDFWYNIIVYVCIY